MHVSGAPGADKKPIQTACPPPTHRAVCSPPCTASINLLLSRITSRRFYIIWGLDHGVGTPVASVQGQST